MNENSLFRRREAVFYDIVALLDNSGAVVVKYRYDAWGNCITTVVDPNASTIAELNPFRYRSYYFDTETGFYFLKTRYYDPEIGRFMTIDEISYLDPENINGLNLYAYCRNNPANYYDSHGNSAIAMFIIGIVASMVIGGLISGCISAGQAALTDGNVTAAFWGSFVTGALSALAVGVGMAIGGVGGALICLGLGFVAGFTGNTTTQAISSIHSTGEFSLSSYKLGDAIWAGTVNAVVTWATRGSLDLWMSDSFTPALLANTFASRFVEFMSWDIAVVTASTIFGVYFGMFDGLLSTLKWYFEQYIRDSIQKVA